MNVSFGLTPINRPVLFASAQSEKQTEAPSLEKVFQELSENPPVEVGMGGVSQITVTESLNSYCFLKTDTGYTVEVINDFKPYPFQRYFLNAQSKPIKAENVELERPLDIKERGRQLSEQDESSSPIELPTETMIAEWIEKLTSSSRIITELS